MADWPECEARNCVRPADCDAKLSGENGYFEGKLCKECYAEIERILNPNIVFSRLLHIITYEELNAALERDFPKEKNHARRRR